MNNPTISQFPITSDFVQAIDKEIDNLVYKAERVRLTTKDVTNAVTQINFYRDILKEEGFSLPKITESELTSMLSNL